MKRWCWPVALSLLCLVFLGACQNASIEAVELATQLITPTRETGAATPAGTAALTPTTTSTSAPLAKATVQPTTSSTAVPARMPTATAVILPTPTAHPLYPYTIAGLQEREFPGGPVNVLATLEENEAFTRYYIDYRSEGLRITGIMHEPTGAGPFPVLILLHGYFERDAYWSGADTWQAAEFFARQGYLVLAPDLRSWGESESGLSLFQTGLVADVLSLISSLPSLAKADPARVGLWGHSMGGGIATKVVTVDNRARAAVLYAPNSADDADLLDRWGPGCLAGQSELLGVKCNPSEIIPPDTSTEIVSAYVTGSRSPPFLEQVAPIYHLEDIDAPIQIHIGTADGQALSATPPEWSARLAAELELASRDVAYHVYEGQGHFFSGESWNTLLTRALSFFDEHLGVTR